MRWRLHQDRGHGHERGFIDGQSWRVIGRGSSVDPAPVANLACFSPITADTESRPSAVCQYDAVERRMKVASNGGQTVVDCVPATPTEAASITSDNYQNMGIWFNTLTGDTLS